MPIKLKSTGGGSVTLDVPSTGTDFTLTLPANNATLLSSNGSSLSNTTFSGNTAISGASSYLNINGINVSPYSGMMKNRIINGDFRIDQRFAGAANNSLLGQQYVVDRWYAGATGAARFRSQQNNTNGPGSSATQTATGFPNYFGANVISSNASYDASDAYYYAQLIEGLNISDLGWGTANASPVTLSFWVYSSIPGSHSGAIANGPANRSYPFTYTISTANTWQYQTITIPGDTTGIWFTNNNIGMYVSLNMGSGSTYTTSSGNSWQAGYYQYVTGTNQVQSYSNGSFYLTGVQLEKGSQATAFDFRHYTTELQLCQRYYQKTYNVTTVPGTATFVGMIGFTVYGGGSCIHYIPYRVSMRTGGSVNFWDAAGNINKISNYNGGAWSNNQGTNATTNYNGENNWALNYGLSAGNPWTSGMAASVHFTASAELVVTN